jgi:hypothetical protein
MTAFRVGHLACVSHYMHKKMVVCSATPKKTDVQKLTIMAKTEGNNARILLQLRKQKSENAQWVRPGNRRCYRGKTKDLNSSR